MKEYKCYIDSPLGLHARPAALIAKLCVNLKSNVTIINNVAEQTNLLSMNAAACDHSRILQERR